MFLDAAAVPALPALRRRAVGLAGAAALLLAFHSASLLAVDGLDDSPGGSGFVPFDLGGDDTDLALACAAQPDGRIVMAGKASDDDGEFTKIAVARVGLNGLPDPGFGVAGRVTIDFTVLGYALDSALARAVVIDAQGRLLVVGTAHPAAGGANRVFVTRLLADGTIDSTFLYNGISGGWYFSTHLEIVTTAALDRAQNLWILGPAEGDLTGDWGFLRLDPNGVEFAAQTIAIADFTLSMPTAILFQPDNKAVIGGWGQLGAPSFHSSFLVHRLLAGAPSDPDPTFGFTNDGWLHLDYPESAQLQSIALAPDLGLIVAGQAGPLAEEDLLIQRLTANGISDGTFEAYVPFDVGGLNGDGIGGQVRMVVQSDGKIVLAARVATGDTANTSDVGVARLLPDNTLDPSFGGLGTGKRVFSMANPPPGNGDDGVGCLLLAAGRPVVAGWAEYIGADTDFAFRRLTSSLIFTDGFESGWTFFWSAAAVL